MTTEMIDKRIEELKRQRKHLEDWHNEWEEGAYRAGAWPDPSWWRKEYGEEEGRIDGELSALYRCKRQIEKNKKKENK